MNFDQVIIIVQGEVRKNRLSWPTKIVVTVIDRGLWCCSSDLWPLSNHSQICIRTRKKIKISVRRKRVERKEKTLQKQYWVMSHQKYAVSLHRRFCNRFRFNAIANICLFHIFKIPNRKKMKKQNISIKILGNFRTRRI